MPTDSLPAILSLLHTLLHCATEYIENNNTRNEKNTPTSP